MRREIGNHVSAVNGKVILAKCNDGVGKYDNVLEFRGEIDR
jgi:hypothetical protein